MRRRRLLFAAALILVLAGAGVHALPGLGDRFIYYPTRYPTGDWHPERSGLAVEDRFFDASDGVHLNGWWAPRAGARATVLFLHGNGGNLTNCTGFMKRLGSRLGVSVFAVDYRGYGRSGGAPSEEGLYRDAEAAYEEVTGRLSADPAHLIIFGHSLGTAVATELALRRKAAGLVLEAPFTRVLDMVKRSVPFADPRRLVSARYDTVEKAPRLALPLLVVHGTDDRTIPVEMGRAVFAAAPEPKELLIVPGAGHADCGLVAADEYTAALERLIQRALGKKPALY